MVLELGWTFESGCAVFARQAMAAGGVMAFGVFGMVLELGGAYYPVGAGLDDLCDSG
ncbi:hypothetical protein K402DRAFT_396724 [Aulographum hederae CBS 113979]|uniref:Uncharacterized protein n=1 Tax=Aulographum hederae CBS 113979 TaxID=1176131 RepID=A0A6G1GRQ8_9PEZI|nr:hypothetical protein K402DRAFT_396724 [Aulographum hederae CBS 113979]